LSNSLTSRVQAYLSAEWPVILADITKGSVDAVEDALVRHRRFVPNDCVGVKKCLLEVRVLVDGALRVLRRVDRHAELAMNRCAIDQESGRDASVGHREHLKQLIAM